MKLRSDRKESNLRDNQILEYTVATLCNTYPRIVINEATNPSDFKYDITIDALI